MYENIIKRTKTVTKDEFLNEEIIIEDCPSDYGLKDNKKFCDNEIDGKESDCKRCWKRTVEQVGIEFKEETPELPKEYTISDLINIFPEETEFIISVNTKYKILNDSLYYYSKLAERWLKSEFTIRETLNMKFIKAEESKLKPMTFEEAVRTGNKIKYKYDGYTLDKFRNTQNIFKHLVSPMYGSKTVSDIILEGTWFAEGVYE